MPSSKNYVRDYKQEYKYHAKPEQRKARSQRNKARRKMISKGRARLGDGLDVAHKNNNTRNNSSKNLAMQSKKTNRSFPRNKKAGRK